jgi:putative hydrolase of HD superfamily
MQRWNDKLRPMQFIEMDKQAHKMVIAYFIGRFEEKYSRIRWTEIIEGGIFEFLQRMVITDIKPTIFHKIKEDPVRYREFHEWIYKELLPVMDPLGREFCERYRDHAFSTEPTLTKRILNIAHMVSSKWEFDFIERANPNGYDIDFIKKDFEEKMELYYDLEGIKQLALFNSYRKFIDLCGQLRFQIRWANLHRIPQTSVMGHSLFVAMLSYLFTLEINGCEKRLYNNYFTGLFHDLPEVLTRDIISPVKRSIEGLSDLIKLYEREQMDKIVYPLVPDIMHQEIEKFTENEFENIILENNEIRKTTVEKISSDYNDNRFDPRDGTIVKAADELSAYIEALAAIENGNHADEFTRARKFLKNKYIEIREIAGINIASLFTALDEEGMQ